MRNQVNVSPRVHRRSTTDAGDDRYIFFFAPGRMAVTQDDGGEDDTT